MRSLACVELVGLIDNTWGNRKYVACVAKHATQEFSEECEKGKDWLENKGDDFNRVKIEIETASGDKLTAYLEFDGEGWVTSIFGVNLKTTIYREVSTGGDDE